VITDGDLKLSGGLAMRKQLIEPLNGMTADAR